MQSSGGFSDDVWVDQTLHSHCTDAHPHTSTHAHKACALAADVHTHRCFMYFIYIISKEDRFLPSLPLEVFLEVS